MGISTHDLLDTIQGLRGYVKDLRHSAESSPFSQAENRALVPMEARDLEELALFLEGVAEEIQGLIPNQTITLKKKEAPPADADGASL
jgi:hypothetical protein